MPTSLPGGLPGSLVLLVLLGGMLLDPTAAARAQVLQAAAAPYEPETAPASPLGTGLTVVALFESPEYAETLLQLAPSRAPTAVLGSDAQRNVLALTQLGIVSLSPTGETAVRLTASSLAGAGLTARLSQSVATVDDLGWLYLAHPLAGLVRLAVTRDAVVLYDPATLASAAGGALAPTVRDIESFDDRLLLAAGPDGLLSASRSGEGVKRIYDVYIDAETAGFPGIESGVEAVSRTPDNEPLLALRAGGKSYAAVLTRDGTLRPVGTGPVADVPLLPGGLGSLGDGGYVLVADDGLHWFSLAGGRAPLLGAVAALSAVRAVSADAAEQVQLGAAFDGCRGQALLRTSQALLTVNAGNRRPQAGDVLVVQADQQSVLRLVRGRDPVPIWPERTLAGPTDVAVDALDGSWVVDAGAQTLFRLAADEAEPVAVRGPAGSPIALVLDEQERPILADLSLHTGGGPVAGIVRLPASCQAAGGQCEDADPGLVRLCADGQLNLPGCGKRQRCCVTAAEKEEVLASGGPLQSPADIAVDANGNLVVADSLAHRIWRVPNMPRSQPIELAEVESPRALALGDAGTVYVVSVPSSSLPALLEVNANGEVRTIHIGEPLALPLGLARRDDGLLLVADGRADPFPGAATTGALLLADPGTGDIRPLLDSWLIRRNQQGMGLAAIPGPLPADCRRRPKVEPPPYDPLPGAKDAAEDDPDGACAITPSRTSPGPASLALLPALLLGLLLARRGRKPDDRVPDHRRR